MATGLTFDTGVLIALERRDEWATALVEKAKRRGVRMTVPAPVIVEWWRDQRGPAAHLLRSMTVEPLTEELAVIAGAALAKVPQAGAIDAVVMASAAQRGDMVYTGDFEHLDALRAVFPAVRVMRIGKPPDL